MSDSYPEHLNPFAEGGKNRTRLSISHSFKELKRTLRRSFRIKKRDEDDITIRQKPETPRPSVTSYPAYPKQELALPRSRFRERLSIRPTMGPNPFDEDEENTYSKMTAARRKMKKRAPLPPNKSHSSQDVNSEGLGIPSSESHWSLTSGDTDYTYSVGNMSREDSEIEINVGCMLEQFKDFNEEMQKLKDDSNNNIITTEEEITKETCTIPDLVISCPSDSESIKLENSTIETVAPATNDIVVEDTKVIIEETVLVNKKVTVIENIEKSAPEDTTDNTEDGYLYHEKKSLYIAGSRDDLGEPNTYTGQVSLYITGSSDNLDASNNNECDIDNKIDNDDKVEVDNNDDTPIPKQRKNKLSKNLLLGI